ncbi:MAG: alanine--tRNA ligase [Methylococcaceae bacterium]
MKTMTSAQLRAAFLNFFAQHEHSIQPSSSLVPSGDATLLFTNAGMVQFKDLFLGREQRAYTRAVTSQRCVRAGGKHNDLENVGYTARHHTFFEMLGNFSFGDYFKREAIHFAWDFLTKELEIPAEKLWVTVFEEDAEAESIWLNEVGASAQRFSKIGAKDNFWSMGDTGPCGPCSEIFYDHGEHIAGGPPGSPDEDGDRYIEIWNLVFMQYDRSVDGTLTPLPKPSVDTGMGLERIAAVLQNVHNNYDIDLFQQLIKTAALIAKTDDLTNSSLRVIADHSRSCTFLVADGVMPSNEGRGYVLRRIIRRAIRHGYRLGISEPFFYKLVAPLVAEMGVAYPELIPAQAQIERVLYKEEQRFAETLEQGMKILEAHIGKLQGTVISGETVFLLYDTYGFPVDLTADVAREQGLTVDHAGFEVEMTKQRDRARAANSFAADYSQNIQLDSQTEFTGYDYLSDSVEIIALYQQGEAVDHLNAGSEGIVVLDKTPFYAESGGQAGDSGTLSSDNALFAVSDTQKQAGTLFLHYGKLQTGSLSVGQTVAASVNAQQRKATELNHSATHLLHAALRQTLGEHVAQKGSLVNAERLRFDFSHFEPVTPEQISVLERLVNEQIRLNNPVNATIMAKDDAVKAGAMALFGEKYGDEVRVLKIGEFSTELCGGTHVERAGDIGCFKIISETGVAAGVRRIEAVTGENGFNWLTQRDNALVKIAELLKSPADKVTEKVEQLLDKSKALEKQLAQLQAKLASNQGSELLNQVQVINNVKVLAAKLDNTDPKVLRELLDHTKSKIGSGIIVLATVQDDKVSLIAGVTKDLITTFKAGELISLIAPIVGGKGGGKPDQAQAGGNNAAGLSEALAAVITWVESK